MRFTGIREKKTRQAVAVCVLAAVLTVGCGSDAAVPALENGNTETDVVSGNDLAETESVSENDARPAVLVKGIYMTGYTAGSEQLDELIRLVEETELNTLVIDVKNDDGQITYAMDSPLVQETGAATAQIPDIRTLVEKCREKDIYLIARVVAFKDPLLAEKRPELAVRKKNGEIFRDKKGLAWVNPYEKEVWDYLVEIAAQAADAGFDEIQFDYIRFSTDLKAEELDFGPEAEGKSRTRVITEFTQYAYDALSPLGVKVSADVYGTVIDNRIDQDIVGQRYADMARHLDYICPMVYPSHYGPGNFGLEVPDAQPYETIFGAMQQSKEVLGRIPEEERAGVRVWLQAFTAGWVSGHISYGAEQLRQQMKGAYDAGYEEWILWNAAAGYKREWFFTDEEAAAEEKRWQLERARKKRAAVVAEQREKEQAEKAEKTEEGQNGETVSENEAEP